MPSAASCSSSPLSGIPTPAPDLSGALAALESDPRSLSASQAAALVSAAANPLLSFDFYRFLRSAPVAAFRADSILFASLLASQLTSTSPHPFRIRFYLGEMKKHNARLSPGELRSLLGSLLPGNPALAISFLDEVVGVLGPDSGTFAAAISVYVENGMVEAASRVAERARADVVGGHSVDFYSSLMGLHRVNRDAKAAMDTFLEMEERGVEADEGIYGILLEILCGVGWTKLSWVVLEEMRRRGGFRLHESLGMDLMRTFLEKDMVNEAGWLLREGLLKEKGGFLLFAELMAEKKMPLVASELLKAAGHVGFCGASLIRGCGKVGLIEEAEKIFQEIACSEIVEDKQSLLSSMVYVYSRAGLRSSAEMVWKQLEPSGGVTGEACLCMMSMYGEMGLLSSAEKVFDQWKHSSFPLSGDGYVVLVSALIKAGMLKKARDRLLEMRNFGMQPTSLIYSYVMEGFLKAGLLNHAAALFDEYKISGLRTDNESTASIIIQILVQTGRYSELRCYLDSFRNNEIEIP